MSIIHRVATALSIAGVLAASALAQDPPTQNPSGSTSTNPDPASPTATNPARDSTRPAPSESPRYRRSVVHQNSYPYPYPNYHRNDESAGFRNPGGTGRNREYYPAGDQFQNTAERDPVQVAKFDQGGGAPDRAEQMQAQSLGIQKYNSIQSHIDRYAQPSFGYGFGVGMFGGLY